MSAAFRELYLSNTEYLSGNGEYLQIGLSGQPPTDDDIYYAFLNHAPSDREDAFRDLYQRLHGGKRRIPPWPNSQTTTAMKRRWQQASKREKPPKPYWTICSISIISGSM